MSAASEVRAAAQRLVEAFARHDTSAYFAFFTQDATFVLHNLQETLLSRQAYLTQWNAWRHDGFAVLDCVSSDAHVQVYDDMAIFHHDVDTRVRIAGVESLLTERETIVFRRTSQGWLACHEHLSARS